MSVPGATTIMGGTDEAPGGENRVQVDNALRAIHEKRPIPEIDFTLHTMEDGSEVSTMERVCKGTTILNPSTPLTPNMKLTTLNK